MTKRSPEEMNDLNRRLSEQVSKWVHEAKEEGIKIGLGADKAELIKKLLQENKKLQAERQRTMPSREEFRSCPLFINLEDALGVTPDQIYDWIESRMK